MTTMMMMIMVLVRALDLLGFCKKYQENFRTFSLAVYERGKSLKHPNSCNSNNNNSNNNYIFIDIFIKN